MALHIKTPGSSVDVRLSRLHCTVRQPGVETSRQRGDNRRCVTANGKRFGINPLQYTAARQVSALDSLQRLLLHDSSRHYESFVPGSGSHSAPLGPSSQPLSALLHFHFRQQSLVSARRFLSFLFSFSLSCVEATIARVSSQHSFSIYLFLCGPVRCLH